MPKKFHIAHRSSPISSLGLALRVVEGFTLIELLVALAIIGIVFGAILSTFDAVRRNSRDAKRQSDLRAIQSALQHYFADQNFYPTSAGLNLATISTAFTSSTGNPNPPASSKTYLNNVPKDPNGSPYPAYLYKAKLDTPCDNTSVKCTDYCLYVKLENPPSVTLPACISTGDPPGYNFYLTQP